MRRLVAAAAAAVVALSMCTTTNMVVVQAFIAPADGCAVFSASLGGDIVLAAKTLSGSLADGGYQFTLNDYVVPLDLDLVAIDVNLFYTMLVRPAATADALAPTTTFVQALIRVGTSAIALDAIELSAGTNGQDAQCTLPILGVSTNAVLPVKTELGATFVTTVNGTITVDVTVVNVDDEYYSTRYVLTAGDDDMWKDSPTVIPVRITAAPTPSPTNVTDTVVVVVNATNGTTVAIPDSNDNSTVTTNPDGDFVVVDSNETMVDSDNNSTVLVDADDDAVDDSNGTTIVVESNNTTETMANSTNEAATTTNETQAALIVTESNSSTESLDSNRTGVVNATDGIVSAVSNETDAAATPTTAPTATAAATTPMAAAAPSPTTMATTSAAAAGRDSSTLGSSSSTMAMLVLASIWSGI
jgi:hypothetical protein